MPNKSAEHVNALQAIEKRWVGAVPEAVEPVGDGERQVVTVQFDERRAQPGGTTDGRREPVGLVLAWLRHDGYGQGSHLTDSNTQGVKKLLRIGDEIITILNHLFFWFFN